jgi:hypothetical protein
VTVGGARLRPVTLADLDALDANWEASAGAPTRYGTLGLNLLWVYSQPVNTTAAALTYACVPAALALQTDTPLIPEVYHEELVKFALVWVRLKEGTDEFDKVLPLLGEFIAAASKLSTYVRARSIERGYDTQPFQFRLFDKSRLVASIAAAVKGANAKPATG